jgi:hypothetical protein
VFHKSMTIWTLVIGTPQNAYRWIPKNEGFTPGTKAPLARTGPSVPCNTVKHGKGPAYGTEATAN